MRGITKAWAAVLVIATGCGDSTQDDAGVTTSGTPGGSGAAGGNGGNGGIGLISSGGGGEGAGGATGSCEGRLTGVVRDFTDAHPDFEGTLGTDPGIVETNLGADLKPVYAGPTPTTNGQMAFDQWYRDTEGVNMPLPLTIVLIEGSGGVFTFDDPEFFPIDDQGFGNQGRPHNYHFTYELHSEFEYQGGEVFTFTGDDDLFTYINSRLAIDLGGVHGPQTATIDLDAQAGALGIEVGNTYSLDFFFAERHTTQSNFRIDTTIGCLTPVTPPS